MTEPLTILVDDPHCLVVAKPAGVATQPAWPWTYPNLEEAVRRHLNPEAPGSAYLGAVQRLDRPVSGVIVWAKTPKAARRLSAHFEKRRARKLYWAVVEGDAWATATNDVWDDWLTAPDASGTVRAVAPSAPGGRRAVTRFRVGNALRLPESTCWLRLEPETGRTHQLRAQAALRGLPILGDTVYGASRPFPQGIALHARALSVPHPILRDTLTWVAPLPEVWRAQGVELPETAEFVG